MSFVYPAFLSAFALLAIPVIIHLFNFKKYTRLFFPNLDFLREVKEKTKKQSQLKHLLVLLCRLLVFSFIVLAFAQPFTGNLQSASPNKVVSIYLDNSFSMQALGKNGALLEVAKQKAIDLVQNASQSTRFHILTNEFSQVSQRLYSKDEALEQINAIDVFPISRTANDVLNRQDELMHTLTADHIQLIHISDFQKQSFAYTQQKNAYPLSLIPLSAQVKANISIDSVWFNNPLHAKNGTEDFYFRVHNHNVSNEETVTLQLFLNERQKAVATITVPAGSTVDSSFTYTNTETGMVHGKLSINDKQIVFDDHVYFSYSIEPFLRVACINDFKAANDSMVYDIKNIFSNDPYYRFSSFNKQNIDFSSLKQFQFIVLNKLEEISSGLAQEIEKYVAAGGSICVIPAEKTNVQTYNTFFGAVGCPQLSTLDTAKTLAEKPNFEDAFFNGIFERKPLQLDLPVVKKHYPTVGSTRSLTTPILKLKNGADLIATTKYKKGKVNCLYTSTAPSCGNLGQHALFVPILLRMAELSITANKIYTIFGKDAGFDIAQQNLNGDQVFTLQLHNTKDEVIPEFKNDGNNVTIFFNDNLKIAGNYDLLLNQKIVGGTSLNYPRTESVTEYYTPKELESSLNANGFKNFSVYNKPVDDTKLDLSSIDNTKKYWTTCIWLALLFLLTETLLLKFWKS